MRSATSLLLVLSVACRHRTPDTPPLAAAPDTPPAATATPGEALGGSGLGFIEASSDDGRFVVLRRWEPGVEPQFGQHGEASPGPELVLLDYQTHTERPLQDLLEVSANRRWLLLRAEGQIWLLDSTSGAWEALAADTRNDTNRCLAPRSAAFSFSGDVVGWIREDAAALVVRDLQSGAEQTFPAEGRLWRGWPDLEGDGAWLMEVAADAEGWPSQRTSCACRWCGRFAMSFGFYGWGGPEWTITAVGADGARETLEGLPDTEGWPWHGPRADDCVLVAASADEGAQLAQGPWRWDCTAGR